jgi:hypothetical protein
MPHCKEIKPFDFTWNLAGFGKSEKAAKEDLQKEANDVCQLWRKAFHAPCSEGTGCGEAGGCVDFGRILEEKDIIVIKNGEKLIKPGQEYLAVYHGKISAECRCAKG